MKQKFILLIVAMLLITGCNNKTKEEKKNDVTEPEIKLTDAQKFKQEYESLNGKKTEQRTHKTIEILEDNAIKYSSVQEVLSLLEGKSGVVYFGYPECPWCRDAVPVLLNTANTVGIETIYYLNIHDMRDTKHLDEAGNVIIDKEGTEEYKELLNAFDSVLNPYKGLNDSTIKRIYFPTVIFIKDGNIIGMHEGTLEDKKTPNTLTKEEEEKLSIIYSTYMHNVLGDVCDASC